MRNSFIISFLIIAAALVSAACTRERAVSDAAVTAVSPCAHNSLEHHPATAPTDQECGNVEYWECSCCGKRFSDSQATVPFTGYIYILPTRFVDLSAATEQCLTRNTVSTIAAIVAVAGLAVTVGGLVTSCISLSRQSDDIADNIEELAALEDKSVEQMKMMEELNDELCEKLSELDESLVQTQESVQELVLQMNTTQNLMDAADDLEDAVLIAILKAEHDIEVAKLLDSRYKSLQDLKFSCISAYRAMHDYLSEARTEIGTAVSRSDSLAVFSQMQNHILGVVRSWGSERACYPSQTATLQTEFMGMTYDDKTSFPDMLSATASEVLPFDHEILVVKKLFTERELCIMALGTGLSSCYYRNCCGSGNLYAEKTAESMENKLSQCAQLRDAFYEKWEEESTRGPWHCNVTGRYFQPDAIWMNVKDFVSNNTVTMKNNIMQSSYNPLSTFYCVSQDEALTELEWELTRKDYLLLTGTEAQDLNSLLFSTDRPGMIFKDTAPQDYARNVPRIAFSIPYSSGEYFSLVDKDDLYYTCIGEDMTVRTNIVEYMVVDGEPDPNGSNHFHYIGSNGLTRFYTVKTSTTK